MPTAASISFSGSNYGKRLEKQGPNSSPRIEQKLSELHSLYLKSNPYDEGDLIYYRINYKISGLLEISLTEAEAAHKAYHKRNPRYVSQGLCETCGGVVPIVPIIYGVNASERESYQRKEEEGRLLIGDLARLREGVKPALFGCSRCKSELPSFGTI